jgi:ribonuclease-3
VPKTPDISYQFSDKSLLKLALSHRSSGRDNNERLELLGDSILGFIIAEVLYKQFPDASEGELSRLRAELVKKGTLAEIARELKLGQALILGEGEKKSGGDNRESILADTLEALVSAVYLDSNLDICRQEVLHWFESRLDALKTGTDLASKDAKTRLQEYLQSQRLELPEYELYSLEGKDHEQEFTVSCKIALLETAVLGKGSSRREAEQQAAAVALAQLHL